MPCDILLNLFIPYSTFANGEVKEVREVKAICFIAKYTTKKAIGYNFFNYYNFRTCETSVIFYV